MKETIIITENSELSSQGIDEEYKISNKMYQKMEFLENKPILISDSSNEDQYVRILSEEILDRNSENLSEQESEEQIQEDLSDEEQNLSEDNYKNVIYDYHQCVHYKYL